MPLTVVRHAIQKPRVGPLQLIPGHPLVPGLVFAAPLHESGSNTPLDYITGAAPASQVIAWTGTQYGHAPDFNGSTRYVRYTDNALWRPGSSAFTVIVLANPAAGASTLGLFSKRNGTNFDQLSLLANVNNNGGSQSGSFGFYFYDTTNTLSACTTSTSQVDGAFHQFALTRVGSSASLYRDGISQSTSFANTGNPNWTGTPSLYLGALGNTNGVPAGGFLNGQIIYAYYWVGRALSAGEIQSVLAEPYQMFQARPIQRWFVLAAAPTYRHTSTRFRLVSASTWRDTAARFRLQSATVWRDTVTRFRLASAVTWRDTASRFRLQSATTWRDTASRLRLQSATVWRDTAARFRLRSATVWRDTTSRFRLQSAATYRDTATRFLLSVAGATWRDTATRLRLRSTTVWRDTSARVRLQSAVLWRDASTRLRLQGVATRDTASRFKLASARWRDVATRFNLSVPGAITTTGRHTSSDRALFVHTVSERALVAHTIADTEPGA